MIPKNIAKKDIYISQRDLEIEKLVISGEYSVSEIARKFKVHRSIVYKVMVNNPRKRRLAKLPHAKDHIYFDGKKHYIKR